MILAVLEAALRHPLRRPRCLPQRRRRPAHRRARRRPRGRRGAGLGARGHPAAPRRGGFRRDQPVRRAASRRPGRKPVERGAETWFHRRRSCPAPPEARRLTVSRIHPVADLGGIRGRVLRHDRRPGRGTHGRLHDHRRRSSPASSSFRRSSPTRAASCANRWRSPAGSARRSLAFIFAPTVQPLIARDAGARAFHRRQLRAGDHRRLRRGLRAGAGHLLDLHAALRRRRAALGARRGRPGPRLPLRRRPGHPAGRRSPSSSTTASSAASRSPMVETAPLRASSPASTDRSQAHAARRRAGLDRQPVRPR